MTPYSTNALLNLVSRNSLLYPRRTRGSFKTKGSCGCLPRRNELLSTGSACWVQKGLFAFSIQWTVLPYTLLTMLTRRYLRPHSAKRLWMAPFVGQQSADLTRCPCLFLYGDVWLDVGIMLFAHHDDLCWNALADPNPPYALCIHHRTKKGWQLVRCCSQG